MPQIQLTPAERKVFRADAHHLDPVVMIGGDGLSAAVIKETEAALNAHGLIKIRVLGDDRAAREAMFIQLADQLNAAPIQHIGKLLVLWRPQPEKIKEIDLLLMNIEGYEFELIPHMLETGIMGRIRFFMCQFHPFTEWDGLKYQEIRRLMEEIATIHFDYGTPLICWEKK